MVVESRKNKFDRIKSWSEWGKYIADRGEFKNYSYEMLLSELGYPNSICSPCVGDMEVYYNTPDNSIGAVFHFSQGRCRSYHMTGNLDETRLIFKYLSLIFFLPSLFLSILIFWLLPRKKLPNWQIKIEGQISPFSKED